MNMTVEEARAAAPKSKVSSTEGLSLVKFVVIKFNEAKYKPTPGMQRASA